MPPAPPTPHGPPHGPGPFNDDKRRVIEATDIVRLIGEQVSLRKAGREFKCVCPFHDDHNPSMCVVPHKQIYHCFVCGAGGDALSFVIAFHKMSFREALQFLADRAGIQLSPPPRRSAAGQAGGGSGDGGEGDSAPSGISRAALLDANGVAQSFFQGILRHPEHGSAARAILAKRGVSEEMISLFGLGASPDRWDGLALTLANKGLHAGPFISAGLLKERENGQGTYDGLRNRLTFPIHDSLGRVIAFGGRRVNDADEPKYLNSPETLLFSKSATLYALHHAGQAIRAEKTVIVCEGYMDAIACHQAGVKNVVATLGTALNASGARVLRRLAETIVLLFDGDEAGQRAADRAVEVLFAEPVDVRIALLSSVPPEAGQPIAKDPDELLKQPRGPERFIAMVAGAVDALEFRFERLKAATRTLSLAARSRVFEEEIARLAELGLDRVQPVRKELIVQRLAAIAGVPPATVRGALVAAAAKLPRPRADATAAPSATDATRAADLARTMTDAAWVVACALAHSPVLAEFDEPDQRWLAAGAGLEGDAALVAGTIARLAGERASFGVADVMSELESGAARALVAAWVSEVERFTQGDAALVAEKCREVLARVRRRCTLEAELAKATDAADRIRVRQRINAEFGSHGTTMPRHASSG
ncbi:MAG: DNA primase [Phycisphaerales bacterium]